MEILAKIFESVNKVKLMRLFLFNQEEIYLLDDIITRTRVSKGDVKKELAKLVNVGLVKKKHINKEVKLMKGKKEIVKKIEGEGYILDQKFPYLQALKNLLITASMHADDSLVKKFTGIGRLKLFLVSGIFLQEWDTRVDLLIVGDDLNISRIESIIKILESEIGREITYSAFETIDFEYRHGMHDRLIRDILDSPHVALVDKLEISRD